jgi:excinuclease ABC subunit C
MKSQELIKFKLPDSPGIYFFKNGENILYIGKATSLRDRVRSYFGRDLINTRGQHLVNMIEEANKIEFKTTNSVLEALILEAYEIKKHQPLHNRQEKDDKSYNYVVVTDETYPRVLIKRGRELSQLKNLQTLKLRFVAGPFPNGSQLKEALKIVRKIFPYRDRCLPAKNFSNEKISAGKPCFNCQIGLCPGVCTGEISDKEYMKTIKNIELFFSGQTDKVRKNLEKEMKSYAKGMEFEKANSIKHTLFALNHIKDVSLIKSDLLTSNFSHLKSTFRIESYDIAHLGGSATVGVMVVIENGEFAKNEYRKFKIRADGKGVTVDDTKNLAEVLTRRLGHAEWSLPNLIVIDGGTAQINIAKKVLIERGFDIEIVSVVKDEKHKPRDIIGKKIIIEKHKNEILKINGEAHRFAIAFHRNLLNKNMLRNRS